MLKNLLRANTPLRNVHQLLSTSQKLNDKRLQKLEFDNDKLNKSILSITKWSRFKEERKNVIDKYIKLKRTTKSRVNSLIKKYSNCVK